MKTIRWLHPVCLPLLLAATCWPGRAGISPAAWQQRIEADWVLAEELALASETSGPVTTTNDAAGGCDGIKNGEWGFHTDNSQNPWWQVDLGATHELERVVIWNRTAAAERAARLEVLLSEDGRQFRQVYQHNGTVFFGFNDHKPLEVPLHRERARIVRLALPGRTCFHLDEVEVFGSADPQKNLALHQPADQISVSQWSVAHDAQSREVDWAASASRALTVCEQLCASLPSPALPTAEIRRLKQRLANLAPGQPAKALFLEARQLQRRLALQNPLLRDFDTLLFVKRVPGSFNHMSDQYYGWWSKPGGGIFLLRGFTGQTPVETCLTPAFREPGSFLRPTLSYDGAKVLFAWCRHYPRLAAEPNKLDKANVPEDAFYHLFEMNLDGSGLRQLTRGKYDDFDGRYLPDGRIVFLSTRRGQAVQVGRESAARTVARPDLPDCYVRCGGGPERPVAVYTLHTLNADGSAWPPSRPSKCSSGRRRLAATAPSFIRVGTILTGTTCPTWGCGPSIRTGPARERSSRTTPKRPIACSRPNRFRSRTKSSSPPAPTTPRPWTASSSSTPPPAWKATGR
ncbi:MAG TPA: discoidin domain-containing protein [Candidatus Paceibacterota bacterium]|nr:discoidin domain-containing protein [Candidatus Paceibacterota bacterium]